MKSQPIAGTYTWSYSANGYTATSDPVPYDADAAAAVAARDQAFRRWEIKSGKAFGRNKLR
ncbi:MAG: hypothetical protein E6Q97_25245 [Desulfurellales bacterium]|nr:MAG: hypothetical protein E6Q97_25245 [Desulfurellales bacterium]